MNLKKYIVLSLFFLAACDTTGQIKSVAKQGAQIHPGMARAEVVQLLGEPGNRSFSGEREALQYCEPGYSADHYLVIWFQAEKVQRLTTYDGYYFDGDCVQPFKPIDWGKVIPIVPEAGAPAPVAPPAAAPVTAPAPVEPKAKLP